MDILKGRRGPALPAVAFGSLVALGLSLFAAPAAAQARRGCEVSHPPGFVPREDEVRNCNPDNWTPDDRRFFGFNPLRAYVASSSRWEVDGSPAHYGPNGFQVTLSVYCKEPVWMEWETADGTATAPADYVAVSGATFEFPPKTAAARCFVETKDDELAEDDEHFLVRSVHPGTDFCTGKVCAAGNPEPAPLCILDDERGGGSSICDNLGSSRNPPDLDDDGAPNRIDLSVNPTVVSEARFEQGPVDVMATLVGGVTRSVDTVGEVDPHGDRGRIRKRGGRHFVPGWRVCHAGGGLR